MELHGRTGIVSQRLPGSLVCVNRDAVQKRDFLDGFLDALVLSLIDDRATGEFHVHILTSGQGSKAAQEQRLLRGIDPERARGYLTGVLAEMLGETARLPAAVRGRLRLPG